MGRRGHARKGKMAAKGGTLEVVGIYTNSLAENSRVPGAKCG